ncbi:MAG: cobalamin biosynthesis protein CbiM [Firmicutes bacterium]|nr:cobalamin biosynthesis protein CbiM [Bacillota bacterium]
MHMADALLSPAVGGVMWATTAGLAAYSVRKLEPEAEDKLPLMGVLGAFVFAAQMINFSIPLTGSSGHLGGGLLLAILLGPYAGFLTMAAILVIQALFFADGGILALGGNIFNLGFFSCFVAYPLIYRRMIQKEATSSRQGLAAVLAAVVALQLGAFGVVVETKLSGITALPFGTFVLLMQPIHLAIGLVEGLATTALIAFIRKARPELLEGPGKEKTPRPGSLRPVLVGFLAAALILGGVASWFASTHPDGLEWSILRVTGKEELEASSRVHTALVELQRRVALLPDYSFKTSSEEAAAEGETWPKIDPGTSVAGLLGAALTWAVTVLFGTVVRLLRKRRSLPSS